MSHLVRSKHTHSFN